jgi:hypothetical protein
MNRLAAFGRSHQDVVASLALLALPFLVLAPAFVPGKVMSPADNVFALMPWTGVNPGASPKNPLLSEIALLFHPSAMHAADEIRSGHFPLWNPHTFGGAPFFANPQTAVLFPLTALLYVLPYSVALTLMSVLKLSIAGVAMYWLLRRLDVARPAALIGAVTFAFSALVIAWLQWSYASAVILLPALFAMTCVFIERRTARAMAGVALIVALSVFAGYPQRVAYWLVVLAAWAVYLAWTRPKPVRALVGWTAAVALGLLLAAVQLLPFAEYSLGSAVLAYRREWMIYVPLPFRAVIATVMPYFFGSPTSKDFWGPANFNEISVFAGVVPWLVMPVAIVAAWSRRGTKFFTVLMALSAALVYGVPWIGELLARVPPLDATIAARNADLLVFSLTVLCGLGLDVLAKLRGDARRRAAVAVRVAFTVVSVGALCFVAAYYDVAALRPTSIPLWAQYIALLLLASAATILLLGLRGAAAGAHGRWIALGALQLAALLPLAVTHNPVVDARLLDYSPPPVVKHLQARTAADRSRVTFSGIGGANLSTIFNLYEFGGYDGMTPRYVEQLTDPVGSLESYASGALRVTVDATSPVFDLLGIRYVVLPPGSMSGARHLALDYLGRDAIVYRNDRALPRAFMVYQARTCLDDAKALSLIHGGSVDFRREVLIAGCPGVPTPRAAGASRVEIKAYADDRVMIAATTDAAGYLVLTDAWFPGWRVWVDGVEQTVWRANHALRAVWLPAGQHDVQFRYVPAAFRWGMLLTLLGAVAVVGLVWRPDRRLLVGAGVVIMLALNPPAADAKLADAPFRLEVTPTVLSEGESLTISVDPRASRTRAPDAPPYDIYVGVSAEGVSADSDYRRGWLYMSSTGAASTTPAAIRRTLTGATPEALKTTLSGLPPGYYFVRVQFVTSAAPATRKHYAYQPLWTTVRVNPSGSKAAAVVMPLGLGLVAALVIVWLPPAWRPRVSPFGSRRRSLRATG